MNGTKPTVKPLPTIPPYGDNAIDVSNLTFSYRSDASGSSLHNPDANNLVLEDMNLSLATGSRCLLIGANGSGKSVSAQTQFASFASPAAAAAAAAATSNCLVSVAHALCSHSDL